MNNFFELRREIIKKEYGKMNSKQFEAVTALNGPLLVLAGAGSGKTTVIINRIANLIRHGDAYSTDKSWRRPCEKDIENMQKYLDGDISRYSEFADLMDWESVKPWKILAITFTNKAANELKDRLTAMLGEHDANDIWAATFHSCCVRILRKYADRIGFTSHFTIYDTDDSKRVMKEVQRLMGLDEKFLPVKVILSQVSKAKDELISPEEMYRQSGNDIRKNKIAEAYLRYEEMLKKADAMDFDDIIVNTVKLLSTCPDVLKYYNDRFSYIMVDEYQDTNHAQYVLTKLLAGENKNICVVGDDDQSIYRFRGATVENILSFEDTYPDARVIRLEQNYRSTQNILNAANAVIKNNESRKGKNLWTDKGDGELITVKTCSDDRAEAEYIADSIIDSSAEGRKWSDYAILYRMNALSNNIENSLVRAGIPYRIIGGRRFYERKEIRDAIAYLSVIANNDDDVRLSRIINEPKRGIGQTSMNNAMQIAAGLGVSVFNVISKASDYPAITRASAKLEAFAEMIKRFTVLEGTLAPAELFSVVMQESGYIQSLALEPDTYEDRVANLDELKSNLVRFREDNPEGTLTDFLEQVALLTDIDNYNSESDTVVLMTIHSAKGLEFPVVFIAGMEEGVFPGMQSLYDQSEIEEERRLCYVGITRAREQLYLLNSGRRMLHGSTAYNPQSRFIGEIPEELKDVSSDAENSYYSQYQGSKYGDSGYSQYGSGYSRSAYSDYSKNNNRSSSSRASYHSSSPSKSSAGGFAGSTLFSSSAGKQTASAGGTFKSGDAVKHKKFGNGLVLKAEKMGNDTLLEVAFDEFGTKKLMANSARLEKI